MTSSFQCKFLTSLLALHLEVFLSFYHICQGTYTSVEMAAQTSIIESETAISAREGIPPPDEKSMAKLTIVEPSHGGGPGTFFSTVQECLFILTVTMAVGQDAIFSGAIHCTTSFIGKDLNMSLAEVTGISAEQSLATGCLLLLFGRVANLFSRRATFLTSMVGFSACLLAMGSAPNAYYLNAFCGLWPLQRHGSPPCYWPTRRCLSNTVDAQEPRLCLLQRW
jgi:hypothetical protein